MTNTVRRLAVSAGLLSALAVGGLTTEAAGRAAPSNGVLRVVRVGSAPNAIAVDARANRAFVVNSGENSVSVLNAGTGLVLNTVRLGRTLTGLDNSAYAAAADETTGRVFVVTQGHPPALSTVSVLDSVTGRVVRTTAVGVFAGSLAVDARTNRVFVTNLDSNTVSMLDARSGVSLGTVRVGQGPSGVAVVEPAGRILVANSDGSVSVLNASTGQLVRSVQTGQRFRGAALIAASSERAFVFYQGGPIEVLDAATGRVLRTVPLHIMAGATAFDARTGQLFVTRLGVNGNGYGLVVLNGRTGAPVRTIPTNRGPFGVVMDRQARRIFVASYAGNSVQVFNADTGATLRTITTANPFAIAVDEQAHRVFVANFTMVHRAGSVTVLDARA